MRLYEIDQEIEQALSRTMIDEETGEILACPDMERLNELQMEREKKLENVALFYKNADAEAKAIAEEIKKLQARKKVLDNKCEGAKNWIAFALNNEKFSTPKCAVSFRKTEQTVVDDIYALPPAYIRIKEPEADKTAIKNAIKAGETIPGCRLEEKISCTIK